MYSKNNLDKLTIVFLKLGFGWERKGRRVLKKCTSFGNKMYKMGGYDTHLSLMHTYW